MGGEVADLSSQAGNDDTEDTGRNPGKYGAIGMVAERHGIWAQAVWKWQGRDSVRDRSHLAHSLQSRLMPPQEAVAVAQRTSLLLPLDDLLSVVRESLNPHVSRFGLDRDLRRHCVDNLPALASSIV